MRMLILERTSEIKKNKAELEKKLDVKISISGKKITIDGNELEEFEAGEILDAIGLGFSTKQALELLDDSLAFRKLNIKNFTNRGNLSQVRARIIGTKGKTKKAISNISGSEVVLSGNVVGVIGRADSIEDTITAITNLIRGSKQSNVYRYLERMNKAHPNAEL